VVPELEDLSLKQALESWMTFWQLMLSLKRNSRTTNSVLVLPLCTLYTLSQGFLNLLVELFTTVTQCEHI